MDDALTSYICGGYGGVAVMYSLFFVTFATSKATNRKEANTFPLPYERFSLLNNEAHLDPDFFVTSAASASIKPDEEGNGASPSASPMPHCRLLCK